MNEQQLSLDDVETLSNISEIERTTTTVKEKIKFVEPMKRCTKCGELKSLRDFYRKVDGKHGRASICKICKDIYNKSWEENHLEERRRYSRESARRRRAVNPEKFREYDRKWRKNNPNYMRETNYLYGRVTSGGRRKNQGFVWGTGICMICGNTEPRVLVNHHAYPISHGEDYILSLCANCHRRYYSGNREVHKAAILKAIENSKFLWSDIDEEDIRVEFNPEIGEESPLVEVLVG